MNKFYFFLFASLLLMITIHAQRNAALADSLYSEVSHILDKPARANVEQAIELCRNKECADTTLAKFYRRLGVIYFNSYISDDLALSYTDTAILLYEKALGKENFYTAESYFNMGTFQSILGEFSNARGNVLVATKSLDKIRMPIGIDRDSVYYSWYKLLGEIYIREGDVFLALSTYEKLLKDYQLNEQQRVSILNNVGLLQAEQGNDRLAIEYFNDIVTNRTNTNLNESVFKSNLGLSYLAIGKTELAENFLVESFNHRKDVLTTKNKKLSRKSKELLSNSHANLLHLYLRIKQYDKAKYHYSEALRLLLEVDITARLARFAEIYLRKGQLEHALGNYDSSLTFLEKAMQVVGPELMTRKGRESINIIGRFKEVLELIGFRARVLADRGEYEAALQDVDLLNRLVTQSRRSYESSLSKYYLIRQVMPVYELGIRLNHQLYRQTGQQQYLEQAYAYNARNKAVLLLESIQSYRAMTFADLPTSVQEREQELRDQLTEQERLLYVAYQKEAPLDSLQNVVFEHEQAYNQFILQLETDYPAYYQLKHSADRPPAVTDIQQQLADDQVLLEYFVGQDSLYTFLFDGAELQVFTSATPAGLADSIALFRELSSNGIDRDCQKTYIGLGRFFYDLLLDRPLQQIDQKRNRLVVVPDGMLNFLAFESFIYKPIEYFRGAEGFVIENYACSYAYSSKLLTENTYYPRSASKSFAGFGTEYDDATLNYLQEIGFTGAEKIDATLVLPCGHKVGDRRYLGPLSFSDDEVRDIAEIVGGDTWLNEQVTKQQFLQTAEAYNFLHLSMHGTYDLEFPMNSSLIFMHTDSSEVFLRAAEIYSMNLTGEMAVLSACNTGYGKLEAGEGPMTLARAFHYAGIPSVVASLWSIPDNSSSRLMKLFYEQLATGLPKDVALREAKLIYLRDDDISSPATRQPVHWAPSIVIGDVAPVEVGAEKSGWVVWLGLGVVALALMTVFIGKHKR